MNSEKAMNSRERVLAAVSHEEPDCVPIDMGATATSGINVSTYVRLKNLLGLETRNVQVFDVFGMMARMEDDVIDRLGIDTILVPSMCPRFGIPINEWKPWRLPDGTRVQVPVAFEVSEEDNGSLLLMVEGKAVGRMPVNETYFSEIANSVMGGIDSLTKPPDPDMVTFGRLTEEDMRFRRNIAQDLYENTDKALIVDLVDNIRWQTSIPNWIYAMAADPDRTYALHKKKSWNLLEKVKQLAGAVGPYVSIFAIYQDYGTQKSELISPAMFERLIVPHYRCVFDWIHENTRWKILFHSCGSIYNIIPHMIDMGVDILNPVQCNATGMEPRRLKAEFGDKLTFWGGGIDTQTALPFGTPEEVRDMVRERISEFAPDGGFVFAPTQGIQTDIPAENLVTMYNTARECGQYPVAAEKKC